MVAQALKEDIIDAINDLKSKPDIWSLTSKQVRLCDDIIKKMVFQGGQAQMQVAHTYDLVRSLFDILRDLMKARNSEKSRQEELFKSTQELASVNEQKLVKHLEIAIDVFRKAADKVGKTGEREWKDVLE